MSASRSPLPSDPATGRGRAARPRQLPLKARRRGANDVAAAGRPGDAVERATVAVPWSRSGGHGGRGRGWLEQGDPMVTDRSGSATPTGSAAPRSSRATAQSPRQADDPSIWLVPNSGRFTSRHGDAPPPTGLDTDLLLLMR